MSPAVSHTVLKVAFCTCDGVTLSDFIPPTEVLAGLNWADHPDFGSQFPADVPYRVTFDFLAPTLDPVKSLGAPLAPTVNPTKTYAEATREGVQYDILWVPAGPLPSGTDVAPAAPSEIEFIKAQAPGARYIISVCGGSAILAKAGILKGRRATTNKAFFNLIKSLTEKEEITWVPKARWVVDGNVWTSSGVSAGTDMALEFLNHLAGPKVASIVRGLNEIVELGQDDDPFAEFHGLV